MGNLFASEIVHLGVNRGGYRPAMDIRALHAARQRALAALAAKYPSQKEAAAAMGMPASYLSRALKDEGEADARRPMKAIGDEMALQIESALELAPGHMLFPEELRLGEPIPARPRNATRPPAEIRALGLGPDELTELLAQLLSAVSDERRDVVADLCATFAKSPDSRIARERLAKELQSFHPPELRTWRAMAEETLTHLQSARRSMAPDVLLDAINSAYRATLDLNQTQVAHAPAGRS